MTSLSERLGEQVERRRPREDVSAAPSASERRYRQLARRSFGPYTGLGKGSHNSDGNGDGDGEVGENGKVDVSCEEMLFGFEADVVLRVQRGDGSVRIVNVEIDGFHHKLAKKKRFCALRDQYLREMRGVEVVRWDLMSPEVQRMRDGDVIKAYHRIVRDAMSTTPR